MATTPSGIRAVTAQDVLYQLNAQSTPQPIQAQNGLQIPTPMNELLTLSDSMTVAQSSIVDTWGAADYSLTIVGAA